jgi:hypothetical protein
VKGQLTTPRLVLARHTQRPVLVGGDRGGSVRSPVYVIVAVVMGRDPSLEVDSEGLQGLFPARAADPDVGPAVVVKVADRQVEPFQGGLLAGN